MQVMVKDVVVKTQIYQSDMSDSQWYIIQDLVPAAKSGGRPRSLEMRMVINAILYVVVGGIQWRMLPKEYPKWQSVYYYFRIWRDDGTWQRMHDTLRAKIRQQQGRHKHPTAGCLDSQTVKTGVTPNGVRGFDGGKPGFGDEIPPGDGYGPGAGGAGNTGAGADSAGGAGYGTGGGGVSSAFKGAAYGSPLLIPLIGGSGGGGHPTWAGGRGCGED